MKNFENKNESETNDTTKIIPKKSKRKECKDTIWKRNCPKCKRELTYSCAYKLKQAQLSKTICRSCNAKKIGSKNIGKRHTDETCKKLSSQRQGSKNPMFGKKRPKYIGEAVSKRNVKMWTGRKHISSTLKKMRESALKRIIQERGCISYNIEACRIFDEINEYFGWNGCHALNRGEKQILGYSVDYYEPSLNIVIEYDEPYHNRQVEKDLKRQRDIIEHLNCKFYRIKYNQYWKEILKNYVR